MANSSPIEIGFFLKKKKKTFYYFCLVEKTTSETKSLKSFLIKKSRS